MRAAPQVLYPLGRTRWLHALLALLLCSSLLLMTAVAASHQGPHLVVAMGLLLLPAGWLSRGVRPAPGSQLWWDGRCWHLQGPRQISGQLHLVLDLQRALLLRWSSPMSGSDRPPTWLWIEEDADPVIWKGVRRAVYWNAR